MKKLCILILALCCALTLASCAKKAPADEPAADEPIADEWGLTLSIAFPGEGASLVFTRTDAFDGELQTGSYYVIETKKDGAWEAVPYREEFGADLVWTMEAWLLPVGETVFALDWSFLYGELPAGEYRIGKEVMHLRAPGDFDKKLYYAEFSVVD